MSTQTFVNALIGLAREMKQRERAATLKRRTRLQCGRNVECFRHEGHHGRCLLFTRPAFGVDVTKQLIESGYFEKASATVFGDALEALLQNSTPTRKPK